MALEWSYTYFLDKVQEKLKTTQVESNYMWLVFSHDVFEKVFPSDFDWYSILPIKPKVSPMSHCHWMIVDNAKFTGREFHMNMKGATFYLRRRDP